MSLTVDINDYSNLLTILAGEKEFAIIIESEEDYTSFNLALVNELNIPLVGSESGLHTCGYNYDTDITCSIVLSRKEDNSGWVVSDVTPIFADEEARQAWVMRLEAVAEKYVQEINSVMKGLNKDLSASIVELGK